MKAVLVEDVRESDGQTARSIEGLGVRVLVEDVRDPDGQTARSMERFVSNRSLLGTFGH